MFYAKLLTTAAVLALLASPAYASSLVDVNVQGGKGGQGGAGGSAVQGQHQGQQQGQQQGQHQSSTNVNVNSSKSSSHSSSGAISGSKSGAAAFNKGNSFSSSTSVDASTDVDAEPAYAPNVNLTSSGCIGSMGGSGGGLGLFSVGFGMTTESVDCFKLEAAKIYLSMGDKTKALAVMESVDYIGAAVGTKQAAAAPAAPVKIAAKIDTSAWPNGDPRKFETVPLECTLGWASCGKN